VKTEYHLRPPPDYTQDKCWNACRRAESFIRTPRARADWPRSRQVEYEATAVRAVQKC